jgi:DNA-binding NarL/FixJ family response regulator
MCSGRIEKERPIRLLLVDDEDHVRQALRTLLETYEDVEVVGEASNGSDALDAVGKLELDLVLMDCRMATMTNGLSATSQMKRRPHPPHVVLLTMFPHLELEARAVGADDFVVKGCSGESLIEVIRRTCARPVSTV